MLCKFEPKNPGKNHTTLSCYLLVGCYHPCWNHWLISICHLRPQEGLPPANKHFQNATHEIGITAFKDVTIGWNGDLIEHFAGTILEPPDLCHQIEVPSDEKALEVFECFINKFRNWETSPDSDFRYHNKKIIRQLVTAL